MYQLYLACLIVIRHGQTWRKEISSNSPSLSSLSSCLQESNRKQDCLEQYRHVRVAKTIKQLHWRLQTFNLGTQNAEARTFTMETQMQQGMQAKTVSMRNCLGLWFGLRPRLPLCLLHLINTGKFVEARANASTGCAHKK